MYACAASRGVHRESVYTSCNKPTIHDRHSDKRTDMVPGLFSNILQCHFFCLTVHFVFTVEVVQASKQACVSVRKKGNRGFVKGALLYLFFMSVCAMYVYVCAHWGWLAAETVSFVVCIIGNINEPHFLHYFVSVYRPFLSWSPIIFPGVIFFLMWNLQRIMRFLVLCCFFFSTVYIFFGTFSPFYQDVKK